MIRNKVNLLKFINTVVYNIDPTLTLNIMNIPTFVCVLVQYHVLGTLSDNACVIVVRGK